MAKHRKQIYAQMTLNTRLVTFLGGSKIDVDGGTTEREVCVGWGSRMGSRSALKMMGSLSRATICSSRERHAVIEPSKAKRGNIILVGESNENDGKKT